MISWIKEQIGKLYRFTFLFSELVKRDFKKKYKRTVLGMGWSAEFHCVGIQEKPQS